MYESPGSLQHVCLDYICDNIDELCETKANAEDGHEVMVYRFDDIVFHANLSDLLLEYISNKNNLTDKTMTLFSAQHANLKHVHIKNAPLTKRGLRILKAHKIIDLDAIGLKGVTVNDLVGCLGEWTLRNLRMLNVCNSTFGVSSSSVAVVVSLAKLKNLQALNVSNTELSNHGLSIIAEDLKCLESLDISNNPISDLTCLQKCKSRLKSLCMYNLRSSHTEDIVSLLCDLVELRHLDVSDDFSVQPFIQLHPTKFSVVDLLVKKRCLPKLLSLDISGKEGITDSLLKYGIKNF